MTAPPQVAARAKPKTTPSTEKTKNTNPRQAQPSQNSNVKLKVVIRGLPPNLPEAKFKETTAEWINESTVDWYYYVGGKLHERGNKPSVRSRAYARFKSVDALATFHKAFNGHIFTDSKGRSSRAMIEFAPFQKYVKGKSKPDARQGTIDTSPEYKEFLDSLSQPVPSEPVVTATEGPTTTPLIEFLRSQKTARAEKEKANKEKMRLAKIAAVQAKANAQTEKLRAEKMQKGIAAANKPVDVAGNSKQGGGGGRGGRGGKAPAKSKDAQRPNRAQQAQDTDKGINSSVTVGSSSQASAVETNASAVAPQLSPNTPPTVANGSGSQGFRGGRGRGGRSRPHGVYRPGAGRGARRGGGPSSNESRPPTSAAEG